MRSAARARAGAIILGVGILSTAVATDPFEKEVEKQAARLRSSDTEGWRKIPWARSLSAAAEMARAEGRPMFLFSHEGNIDSGRC